MFVAAQPAFGEQLPHSAVRQTEPARGFSSSHSVPNVVADLIGRNFRVSDCGSSARRPRDRADLVDERVHVETDDVTASTRSTNRVTQQARDHGALVRVEEHADLNDHGVPSGLSGRETTPPSGRPCPGPKIDGEGNAIDPGTATRDQI
jgi:hypothetical protein